MYEKKHADKKFNLNLKKVIYKSESLHVNRIRN